MKQKILLVVLSIYILPCQAQNMRQIESATYQPRIENQRPKLLSKTTPGKLLGTYEVKSSDTGLTEIFIVIKRFTVEKPANGVGQFYYDLFFADGSKSLSNGIGFLQENKIYFNEANTGYSIIYIFQMNKSATFGSGRYYAIADTTCEQSSSTAFSCEVLLPDEQENPKFKLLYIEKKS